MFLVGCEVKQFEFRARHIAVIDKAVGAYVVAGGFGPRYATKRLALNVNLCIGSLRTRDPADCCSRGKGAVALVRIWSFDLSALANEDHQHRSKDVPQDAHGIGYPSEGIVVSSLDLHRSDKCRYA